MSQYIAQCKLTNDTTKKVFEAGDVVQDGDFEDEVIKAWLKLDPPALKAKVIRKKKSVKKGGDDSGSREKPST